MGRITTASLRVEGMEGLREVLSFGFHQFPGEHAYGKVEAVAREGRVKEQGLWASWIRVVSDQLSHPLFCGKLQGIEEKQVNGYTQVTLKLVSGSILLDQRKESHSYQDVEMSYGRLLKEAADKGGGILLYPNQLDGVAMGFPRIQYEETTWAFLKRMASHQGLSLYPQLERSLVGLSVGVPLAKAAEDFSWRGYSIVWDGRYAEQAAEEAGHTRDRFITYEVESEGNYECGQEVVFQGKTLTICAKDCLTRQGEVLFTYRLAYPEWAGQRRLENERLSGLSLLGKVVAREAETLKLKLDIDQQDEEKEEERAYAFSWRPPTGNLMYMMPEVGSQVSLYFPSAKEEGAMVVNCIRQEGEAKGKPYQERGLKTEGKELKLYPTCVGVESLRGRVMLDDLEGIQLIADKGLQIQAAGGIQLLAREVVLGGGTEGIYLSQGRREEGEERIFPTAQLYLLSKQRKERALSLGEATLLVAAEYRSYEASAYRFRDDPQEAEYDTGAWKARGTVGLLVIGAVVVIAGISTAGLAPAGMAASTGLKVMGATAVAGLAAVGTAAATDYFRKQISSYEDYVRAALGGSIIGAFTGASMWLPHGGWGLLKRGFFEVSMGGMESVLEQSLWEEEIDFKEAVGYGILNAILAGAMGAFDQPGVKRLGGGTSFAEWMTEEDARKYLDFLEKGSTGGLTSEEIEALKKVDELLALKGMDYQDIWEAGKASKGIEGGTVPKGTLSGKLDGLTTAERTMVDDLLNAGNNVEIIPRSNIPGDKTPDFLVNGVKTELKTLTGTSLNTPVTRIQDGFKQGAEAVIIDGRNTGLTLDDANTVMERALGKYGGELPGIVEIWTTEGILRR